MAANKAYLEQLLETDRFYGGNNTVEQCIRLNDYDNWLENGGYSVQNGHFVDNAQEAWENKYESLVLCVRCVS